MLKAATKTQLVPTTKVLAVLAEIKKAKTREDMYTYLHRTGLYQRHESVDSRRLTETIPTLHPYSYPCDPRGRKIWALYEIVELVKIMDTSLNDDFNLEEAYRFLKVGLICTQDTPKVM